MEADKRSAVCHLYFPPRQWFNVYTCNNIFKIVYFSIQTFLISINKLGKVLLLSAQLIILLTSSGWTWKMFAYTPQCYPGVTVSPNLVVK